MRILSGQQGALSDQLIGQNISIPENRSKPFDIGAAYNYDCPGPRGSRMLQSDLIQ